MRVRKETNDFENVLIALFIFKFWGSFQYVVYLVTGFLRRLFIVGRLTDFLAGFLAMRAHPKHLRAFCRYNKIPSRLYGGAHITRSKTFFELSVLPRELSGSKPAIDRSDMVANQMSSEPK